jgi:hypothetical protein
VRFVVKMPPESFGKIMAGRWLGNTRDQLDTGDIDFRMGHAALLNPPEPQQDDTCKSNTKGAQDSICAIFTPDWKNAFLI